EARDLELAHLLCEIRGVGEQLVVPFDQLVVPVAELFVVEPVQLGEIDGCRQTGLDRCEALAVRGPGGALSPWSSRRLRGGLIVAHGRYPRNVCHGIEIARSGFAACVPSDSIGREMQCESDAHSARRFARAWPIGSSDHLTGLQGYLLRSAFNTDVRKRKF